MVSFSSKRRFFLRQNLQHGSIRCVNDWNTLTECPMDPNEGWSTLVPVMTGVLVPRKILHIVRCNCKTSTKNPHGGGGGY